MDRERWQQIERLYHDALARPVRERAAFVAEACAGDDSLRQEVEALLATPPTADGVFAVPALAVAAPLAADSAYVGRVLSDPPPLTGRQLGVYRLQERIGAGGMGEVYRARDTRLARDVAIKILPRAFSDDPDRLARFEREARVLAALNHPNIATIHGVEEAGPTDAGHAVRGLVMELVEGETLAERIARGPVSVLEALPLARQIAEALEAAHEKGVVHRDLKPANIKVTPAGTVKVLDFGLAKAVAGDSATADLTAAPTITRDATREGLIVGTAAYMSPEQARGQPVDKRTDIWAFGCVVYEMLTGRPPFPGATVSDTIAAILEREPAWDALPASTPSAIRRLLRRCLAKDRPQRLADASDVCLDIDEAQAAPAVDAAPPVRGRAERRTVVVAMMLAFLVGGLVIAIPMWLLTRSMPPRVTRLTLLPSSAAPLALDAVNRDIAISRDGTRVVYVAANGTQLVVRALDQLVPTVLGGLGAPSSPVFSPDGRWIAFFDGGNFLKKIATTGGPVTTLTPIKGPASASSPSWGADDTIVFSTISGSATGHGLLRVGAAGGEPQVLTIPDAGNGERGHVAPHVLPGGHAVLFGVFRSGAPDGTDLAVVDLRTGSRKVLIRSANNALYVAPGYLVYAVGGTLWAVAFDLGGLTLQGSAVPVVQDMLRGVLGAADFDVASDGTLVYLSGTPQSGAQRTLVWVDRQGREQPLGAPPRAYIYPRLSPDGTHIAVAVTDQENDVWIWDLTRRIPLRRFTFDAAIDLFPVWMPDGRQLVWGSTRRGLPRVYRQTADGTGTAEELTGGPAAHYPTSVTPDGTQLVIREAGPDTGQDIVLWDKARGVTRLIQTTFNDQNGEISPDGRWLAYESDESGQFEIYIRPFPSVNGGRWVVSTGGGRQPLWAAHGRELFYRAPNGAVMGVSMQLDEAAGLRAGTPATLVQGRYYNGSGAFLGRTYDASRDGRRFLMIQEDATAMDSAAAPIIVVVQNWTEELKRLVPRD